MQKVLTGLSVLCLGGLIGEDLDIGANGFSISVLIVYNAPFFLGGVGGQIKRRYQ